MSLPRQRLRCTAWAVMLVALIAASASAQITRSNVLLIVNTNSPDSVAIRDAYRAKYGPTVRAWHYAGSVAATITRATFESEIRNPLRSYLQSDEGDGIPLCQKIMVLVTTRGVPHRIDDVDYPGLGDNVAAILDEYPAGRYDAASLDSELVLLHQNLQAGPSPVVPCYANNHIQNPYHATYAAPCRIDTYSRANVLYAKTFVYNAVSAAGWQIPTTGLARTRLTPGDMYLVTRITGYTAAEAIAALGRAGAISVNRSLVTTVIDRRATNPLDGAGPYSYGQDFPQTRDQLQATGWNVTYDDTATFLTTAPMPVLAYAGYGVNHSSGVNRLYILQSLQFTLAPGAIFNTYESWNGRRFETTRPDDPALDHDSAQGQVADWIHIGGTLGLGHVWEPTAFSVADNRIMLQKMLNEGWTFAEAAWASIPVLSWQNIVVGDPLATFVVASTPPAQVLAWEISVNHENVGNYINVVTDGYIEPRRDALQDFIICFDKNLDPATISAAAISLTGRNAGDLAARIAAVQQGPTAASLAIHLTQPLADGDRYTLALTDALRDADGLPIAGDRAFDFAVLVGDIDASGAVTNSDMILARAAIGQTLDPSRLRSDVDRSGTLTAADMMDVRRAVGNTLP